MKLHLGCGWRNFGKEWVHIDNGDYEHLNYKTNVDNLYMIADNSVDLIYASHVLEYFDRDDAIRVLKEWHRVLKENGILRIAVPDFYQLSVMYLNNNIDLNAIIGPLYGKMKMDQFTIYHKTVYDFKSLEKLLVNSNFKDVHQYDWKNTEHAMFDDHSQAYIPHMDKTNGILISLNVECKKI